MVRKAGRKSTTQEGRGSKEGIKKQSTVRRSKCSQNDDDGTQIEQAAPKKGAGTRRRRQNTQKTETEAQGMQQALRQFTLATVEAGVDKLVKEFNDIKAATAAVPAKTAFDANPEKNRYKDVFCVDESRVILTWPPGNTCDYVHANWVPIKGEKKFICTQGPTDKTVDDFWRLVYQEKIKAIVMLCNILEMGKKKCEQYWPEKAGDKMTTSHGISIKTAEVTEPEKALIVSKLEISVEGGESFVVSHWLWQHWPDRGVPENFMACFRLLTKLKPFTPALVHCSAGIGRTGTIVGLEMAHQVLLAGERLVMADVVKELRSHRHGSVQTDIQYVYMHRVLISLAENRKIVKHEEIAPFFETYDAFVKSRGG
uniref:Protein-tyrosine phosphatase n=1 Tax=Panagrellus redivivus TaxID=6233 RepID=A0A7E4VDN1_PANRE